MDRLWREVSSEYFPADVEEAVATFRTGPLARPKEALVHNFVVVLTKALLLDNYESSTWNRLVAALNAVRKMHWPIAADTLASKLSEVVSRIDDGSLWRILAFLRDIPDTLQYLQSDLRGKLARYVASMPKQDLIRTFDSILALEPFRSALDARLLAATSEEIAKLVTSHPCAQLVRPAFRLYSSSPSFPEASPRRKSLVIPLVPYFKPSHVHEVIQIIATEHIVRNEYNVSALVDAIAKSNVVTPEELTDVIRTNGLEDKFPLYCSQESPTGGADDEH